MKTHRLVLSLLVVALLIFLYSCQTTDTGPQGHTTWTVFWAALAAAIIAFVTAPLDAIVAIGSGIAIALAFLAFSPKYPLNPPRTPDGHTVPPASKPEKSFTDKTWWEVIHG